MMKTSCLCILAFSLLGACNFGNGFTNAQTSEIGDINGQCMADSAWRDLCREYSVDSISDSALRKRARDVRKHFIPPKYVLYFTSPDEIVGCDFYSIRCVYSPTLIDQVLDGSDIQLSNAEQVRIRNRVLQALMKYQCEDGRKRTLEDMKKPAPFAEEHKEYSLEKATPEMQEAKSSEK